MSRSAEIDLPALLEDTRVVWTEDILRFGDTDANGHINNAAFAVFCESGRVNLLHDALATVRDGGGFFVVAKLTIEFKAELRYPGRVRCGTWIAAFGRTSVTFEQALLDEAGRARSTRRPAPRSCRCCGLSDPPLPRMLRHPHICAGGGLLLLSPLWISLRKRGGGRDVGMILCWELGR